MFRVAHAVRQATYSLTVEATSAVFLACSTASLLVEYDRRHLQRLAGASPSFIVARHGYHLTVLIAQPFLRAAAYHPSQPFPKLYERRDRGAQPVDVSCRVRVLLTYFARSCALYPGEMDGSSADESDPLFESSTRMVPAPTGHHAYRRWMRRSR